MGRCIVMFSRGEKRDFSTPEYEVKYKRSTGGVQEEYEGSTRGVSDKYALLESRFFLLGCSATRIDTINEKITEQIRIHVPTRHGALVYVKTRPRKNGKIEAERPAKSPDLNPIEMLWSILDKKLAAKLIYSKMEPHQRLEEEWKGIKQLSCLNLIGSVPNRIQKCLKWKGGHFM